MVQNVERSIFGLKETLRNTELYYARRESLFFS